MFSLIIAIVSIALVVALVAATMYHGGDTLTQGRTKADAAAYVAGAQQITGAAVMHLSLEGQHVAAGAAGVTELVTDKYLASAPTITNTWAITSNATERKLEATGVKSVVCSAINKAAGDTDGTVDAAALANLPYGCIEGGAADQGTFTFKF